MWDRLDVWLRLSIFREGSTPNFHHITTKNGVHKMSEEKVRALAIYVYQNEHRDYAARLGSDILAKEGSDEDVAFDAIEQAIVKGTAKEIIEAIHTWIESPEGEPFYLACRVLAEPESESESEKVEVTPPPAPPMKIYSLVYTRNEAECKAWFQCDASERADLVMSACREWSRGVFHTFGVTPEQAARNDQAQPGDPDPSSYVWLDGGRSGTLFSTLIEQKMAADRHQQMMEEQEATHLRHLEAFGMLCVGADLEKLEPKYNGGQIEVVRSLTMEAELFCRHHAEKASKGGLTVEEYWDVEDFYIQIDAWLESLHAESSHSTA